MNKWTMGFVATFFVGSFVYFSMPDNQDAIFPKIVGCYSYQEVNNGVQFEIVPGFVKFGDKIIPIEAGKDKEGYFILPKHDIVLENSGSFSINSGNRLKLRFGPKNEYLEIINIGSVVRLDKDPCT